MSPPAFLWGSDRVADEATVAAVPGAVSGADEGDGEKRPEVENVEGQQTKPGGPGGEDAVPREQSVRAGGSEKVRVS